MVARGLAIDYLDGVSSPVRISIRILRDCPKSGWGTRSTSGLGAAIVVVS